LVGNARATATQRDAREDTPGRARTMATMAMATCVAGARAVWTVGARGGATVGRGGARLGTRRPRARAATTADERATASVTSTSEFRVYIEHTDGYGVVFYATYFRFLAHACEEFESTKATTKAARDASSGFDFSRARCVKIENCKYARAATLGDVVRVRSTLTRIENGEATLRQEIVSANDEETLFLVADVTYGVVVDESNGSGLSLECPFAASERATTDVKLFRSERSLGESCSHVDALRFFERGRTDAIGGPDALSELKEAFGVVVVVSRLEARFSARITSSAAASTIPNWTVASSVEIKRRGIQVVFHQSLVTNDGTCVGYASITCTCLDGVSMRPISCPEALVERFAPFTVSSP